ncbi:MAG: hypothetical protein V3U65_13550 [Granulosicoccaceae bacterium]
MQDINFNISYPSPPPSTSNDGVGSSSHVKDPAANPAEFKNAVAAYYAQQLGPGLKAMISSQQGIPQSQKEAAYAAVDRALATGDIDTPAESLGLSEEIMKLVSKMAKENLEEADGEAKKKARGGAGNWLVAMAKALSAIAGVHLGKMVSIAGEIGKLSHTDTAGLDGKKKDKALDANAKMATEMAGLTAEMQAHGQMYKLVQEATTTSIKTVGEALHSTARKQ